MIPTIRHFGKGKIMETVKRLVIARETVKGEMKRWSTKDF